MGTNRMTPDERQDAFAPPFSGGPEVEYELRVTLDRGFLGISSEGAAVLVVPLSLEGLPTGRVLGSVRLSFRSSLRFAMDGRRWDQPAGIVECLDAALLATFSVFARDVEQRLDSSPASGRELLRAVEAWDHLLRRRPALSPEGQLGLWGELTVLSWFPDLDRGVDSWTGPEGHPLDFLRSPIGLEVKTSRSRLSHHVSLSQRQQLGTNLDSHLVSLWVMTSDEGVSLPELCSELEAIVEDQAAFRKCLLAAEYSDLDRDQYSERYVLADEPWVVPMSEVPCVGLVDPDVSRVRYTIDLSARPSLRKAEILRILAQMCIRRK